LASVAVAALLVCAVSPVAARYYGLAPLALIRQFSRVTLTRLYARLRSRDVARARTIVRTYCVGLDPLPPVTPLASWQALARGRIRLLEQSVLPTPDMQVPFVYESASAAYLRELNATYRLEDLIKDAKDEYGAMMKLAAWVGTRWDHGSDAVPGGNQVCNPTAVVAAGERGAKFWCEIAARTLAHAANSVGWIARVLTGSRDGYTWEHAVTELWSNQFNKWFAIDADFNVVYEAGGIPLSGFELSSRGEQLQRSGELTARRFAPDKASLPLADLVPFYRYVHVDLRADWCSRRLAHGSPAGGDLATWWTARPSLRKLLTAKVRVDEQSRFDWRVNTVGLYGLRADPLDEGVRVHVGLSAYSPVFECFEVDIDEGGWRRLPDAAFDAVLGSGPHSLRSRIVTRRGDRGPISEARIVLAPEPSR